ncbi:bifunctional hydroxymethylpyrimidine kinase/phosphomethylpyrimidine kinase [Acetobacteraceae bacterium]|nr:bifunctional hydroxymethylpyrimidine kinase/phosphomethylpyrimidine kinase [Acetobacteraceae bacterium]
MIANILSIAGSDPSGGAGIQADIKSISATKAYALAVITCLTATNTQGVQDSFPIPADFISKQIKILKEDIHIDAIKIGMLGTVEIIETVYNEIKNLDIPIVLDPVMVCKGGHRILDNKTLIALREKLLPLATLITPNLPETGYLLQTSQATSHAEIEAQGKEILKLGAKAVLIKGGYLQNADSTDFLITPSQTLPLPAKRCQTKNTHGTGCSLSAAIASFLGQGLQLPEAVQKAKIWLHTAIRKSERLNVGTGCGPIHHFHELWED